MVKSYGEKRREELEGQETVSLADYALKSKERREQLGKKFREHLPKAPLEYRTEYHRDRDRIVWSKSFKRLQHKTQIFPYYVEDHYRRRLTHSLEVTQIATTVARALNLNEVATEAIALGHDLGHTPFGHAGEKVLNQILIKKGESETFKNLTPDLQIPLFGFDHCVHAIEVVSRIEQEYKSESNYPGLNLTFDVRDGILKHMFSRNTPDPCKPLSDIPSVVRFAQYEVFENNKSSLEAQCVSFADKVAYLFSDIEDGLRCRVLKYSALQEDEFLQTLHEKYRDRREVTTENKLALKDFNDLLIFRRRALAILILECIEETQRNVEKECDCIDKVLRCSERLVCVPKPLNNKWKEFYNKWMGDCLFKDKDIVACSFKAECIIRDLFEAYMNHPNLISKAYREECETAYRPLLGDNEELLRLVQVRNYIAGMTDSYAIDQHARLFMSTERVRLS